MKKALKKWNAQAIDNEKLKPNMRKWKKGLFGGWTWIGEGAPESYGSWVTYSGTKTIQTSMQEYDTISTTIYIWEGPEPPGGRPPRPDLTPEAVAARTAWQMEEAAARAAARSASGGGGGGGLPVWDGSKPLPDWLDELEKRTILDAWEKCAGVKTRVAELLGVKPSALYYTLEKYGIG